MSLSFAHAWQQQESSDMDVLLLAPEESGEERDGQPARIELARFPAHSILLSNSAVLWCRVLRWQDEKPCTRAAKRARHSSSNNNSSGEQVTRLRLELELQDASEQQAALAVLQSLYVVKPLPELLSELSQEQQLHAAMLADKWQVPHVSSAAAQLLADAASTPGTLAEAVQQRKVSAEALPDCLQPLLKSVLLSLFGDLEAVWADAGLQEQLLRLPLHAMELLLSCDELKVASEDTVLYTARRYSDALKDEEQQQHAKGQLARLVRCPHLSHFWLSGSVNSAEAGGMLLAELRPQIRRLLLLQDVYEDYELKDVDLQDGGRLVGAPPSWALGCRDITPVTSVQLVWQLEVSKLRDAARRSAAEQLSTEVFSPYSPPIGGIGFVACLYCDPQEGAAHINLTIGPVNLPGDMLYKCTSKVTVEGQTASVCMGEGEPYSGHNWNDREDWFELGRMAEGWDEVAWAGKGLPSSGHLTIKLEVSKVPHTLVPRAPAAVGRRR